MIYRKFSDLINIYILTDQPKTSYCSISLTGSFMSVGGLLLLLHLTVIYHVYDFRSAAS